MLGTSTTKDQGLSAGADRAPADRLGTALALVALAISALLIVQMLALPLGRDQATFAVIGSGMLEGRAPYSEAWDIKPPGIFFLYALADALFGPGESAPRLLEAVSLGLTGWGFWALTRPHLDPRAAAIGFLLAVVAILQFGFWHVGQPETFAAPLLVWAVLATERRYLFAAGALYGFAALLKPSFAGGGLVALIYVGVLLSREGAGPGAVLRAAAVLVAGGLSVFAATALYLHLSGALPAFVWTLFVFAPNYLGDVAPEGGGPGLAHDTAKTLWRVSKLWPVLPAAIALGLVCGLWRHPARGRALHLCAVAAFPLIGVALQGKFFAYHYLAALAPLALVAGWGVWLGLRRSHGWPLVQGAILVALALLLALPRPAAGLWDRTLAQGRAWIAPAAAPGPAAYSTNSYDRPAIEAAAAYLRERAAPGAGLYVWGFEPSLYLLSGLRPPTRFVSNFPQRVGWSAEASRAELMRDLAAAPPDYLVIESGDVMRAVTGDRRDSRAVYDEEFAALRDFVGARYALAETIGPFEIHQRRATLAARR
ncbi:ArnT family glycosyltransferase [Limimaricola pyoseonensis]|uniref:Dolichyl-phosphate-mannose-protein mannosyltransferase n=1 Tax=Limimaricola pyoseonensis TaxID=521013 RepID=A0A1G7J3D8_9RHOB|nr:glycosyltransferase family 39 protein [Limimaricola pyoseonensis]SDF19029.1 Dolichyl-phosphate-mannose-protein mannosyltransferase [Limimaricola pyoseonensis]